jgi:hypothetical protein
LELSDLLIQRNESVQEYLTSRCASFSKPLNIQIHFSKFYRLLDKNLNQQGMCNALLDRHHHCSLGYFLSLKSFLILEGEILILLLLDAGTQFVLIILFFEGERDLYLNKRDIE